MKTRVPASRDPRLIVRGLCLMLLLGTASIVFAEDDGGKRPSHRGYGYLGGFFVTQVDAQISVFAQELGVPLGARVDVSKDLGFGGSFVVPRASLGWRFGKRHVLTGGYYGFDLEGKKVLQRVIELPFDVEFPVGVEVESSFKSEIYKLEYTWIFHRDPKVDLGVGGGLFVSRLGFAIRATEFAGFLAATQQFDESVTAPLPVLGGTMSYHITPKLDFLATADWFFLEYQGYSGILGDYQFYASHRTFKHVGFGWGLNVQNLRGSFEDRDLLWEIDTGFVGWLGALTFYF